MGEVSGIDESVSGTDRRAQKPSVYLGGLRITPMGHVPQPGGKIVRQKVSDNWHFKKGKWHLGGTFLIGAKNKFQMDQKQNCKIS